MLPDKYRLRDKKEIELVRRHGRYCFSPHFKVEVLPNNKACYRFAFVISIKVIKKASGRVFLKRQLRSIVYEYITEKKFKTEKSADVIIRVKKAPEIPYDRDKMKLELEQCLNKLSLI